MDLSLDDTIAAIATAPGEAALAVVRVSGVDALPLADRVFRGSAPLAAAAGHTLHHGWVGADERIEEVVAAVFRAPRSYTREDVVELSCHGGDRPARAVLAQLLAAGARLARPGEFTLRAFVSGRLDLVQAEAVAELIGSRSESQQRAALSRLAGTLSRELRATLERLADALADLEARVDFAEDVGGVETPPELIAALEREAVALRERGRGAAWARAQREGVQVAIVGRPNAGKSSLFNRLVGEDRAIVTELPGTTRDRVSSTIEIAGAPFTLSDTAGLREAADRIEAEGVSRARAALAESRVVLWVLDGSRPMEPADRSLAASLAGKAVVAALNKRDVGRAIGAGEAAAAVGNGPLEEVATCAVSGEGADEVRGAIARAAGFEPGDVLASERQAAGLSQAVGALDRAAALARRGQPGEIVAIELRAAIGELEELLGLRVQDGLLERIFARFCVGK